MRSLAAVTGVLLLAIAVGVVFWLGSRTPEPGPAAVAPPAGRVATHPEPLPIGGEARRQVPPPAVPAARGISGRVVAANGRPIASAQVALARVLAPWPEERVEEIDRALTGPDGRFQFEVRTPDDLVIEASAAKFATSRVPAPREVSMVQIRLEPGFTVQGVVVGPDMRAVDGCFVALEPGPWGSRRAIATSTDRNGRFRFVDVPAGESGIARITARHAPFQPVTLSSFPVGSDEPVRLQLAPVISLPFTGRVVRAAAGTPIEGASVRVFPSTAWNGRRYAPYEATTDSRGLFQVGGLSLGAAFVVVEHPELSATSRVVTVGRGSLLQTFEMVRRSSVEVRLTGEVDPGLELSIVSAAEEVGRAAADADGVVRFDRKFSAGPATLEIVGGRRAFVRSSGRILSVAVEEAGTELELALARPSRVVGRVVDEDGAPVAGVTLSTPRYRFQPRNPERWFAQTDDRGRFEFLGLPVGSASLKVEHPDYAPIEVDVETPGPAEERTVDDVHLVRPGFVRGRVTRGGAPMFGVAVLNGRERGTTVTTVSDPDGNYELRVAPGSYRILARFSTMPMQVSDRVVAVEAGSTVDGVDIEFPPGRRVAGVVTGAESLPVSDAFVFVGGAQTAFSTTDQNGRFEMELPPGPAELQIFSPNFQIQVREPVAARAEQVNVRLPWIAHGTLRAVVLGMPGARPLGEVLVRVTPLDERKDWDVNVRRQRTVPALGVELTAGRMELDKMPAGHSRVEIAAPGFVPFAADVEVARGAVVDLGEVRLEPGAEVRGVVRDAEGRPVPGCFVHLGREEDLRFEVARRAMTDAQGTFRIGGVAPRSSHLVVHADGFMASAVDLRFPEDLLRNDPIPIVLRRAGTLIVRIERDGAPVSDYPVVSIAYEGELMAIRMTDDEGKLSVPVERPGRYSVGLFGREERYSRDVEIGAEPVRREVRIDAR